MNQTYKSKLRKVTKSLEDLKNKYSQGHLITPEEIDRIRSKEDTDLIRKKIEESVYGSNESDFIEDLKNEIEEVKDYYEDKQFDLDYDNPRYESYEDISDNLESASDELDEIINASEEYDDIIDKIEEIEDAISDLESLIDDLKYECNSKDNYEQKSHIDEAINYINKAIES